MVTSASLLEARQELVLGPPTPISSIPHVLVVLPTLV